MMDAIKAAHKWLAESAGIRIKPYTVVAAGVVLIFMGFVFMPDSVSLALSMALFLAPLWLPVLLIGTAWELWVTLRRSEYIAAQKTVVLEVKPPRNLARTPLAMETFLQGIHHSPGEGNWYNRSIRGQVRPWWSLELASLEGKVHFYIWTRASFRRLLESQLYAQYPGAQVVEVPDYTRVVTADPHDEWAIWGCDFVHTADDAIPLKTYIEYGLDKVQKEHEQVDPLANLIEFLGAMGPGEYIWLQLPIRVHKGEKFAKTNEKGSPYTWKDQGKDIVEEMRKKTRDPYIDAASGEERPGFPNPTKGQMEKMAAIERNVSKLAFDVGARCIYLVDMKKGKFDPINISGVVGIFKQFTSEGWNGFRPKGWMTKFEDYPWEIGVEKLKQKYIRALVEAYRRRQYFHAPFRYGAIMEDAMVMSTEELATIYHIPSAAVTSPSLDRIQSATSEAPSNLPV